MGSAHWSMGGLLGCNGGPAVFGGLDAGDACFSSGGCRFTLVLAFGVAASFLGAFALTSVVAFVLTLAPGLGVSTGRERSWLASLVESSSCGWAFPACEAVMDLVIRPLLTNS